MTNKQQHNTSSPPVLLPDGIENNESTLTNNSSTNTTTSKKKVMPLLPISSLRTIDLCQSLPLLSSDIFICSYPKSGTTWTQHIVLSLIIADSHHRNKRRSDDDDDDGDDGPRQVPAQPQHVSEYAPFYEIDAHWNDTKPRLADVVVANHERLGRRVFNTHLWWDMLPGLMCDGMNGDLSYETTTTVTTTTAAGGDGKFIYVVRSGVDACVSFYHHLSNQIEGGYDGSFDDFFQDWIDGNIAFGSYLDHLLSFAKAIAGDVRDDVNDNYDGIDDSRPRRRRRLLLLSYESMIMDLPSAVRDVISFLGLDIPNEMVVNDLLPTFSFETMKKNINMFQPRSVGWKKGNGENKEDFCFLRRGKVGDGARMLSDNQKKAFRDYVEKAGYVKNVEDCLGDKDPEALKVFLSIVKV